MGITQHNKLGKELIDPRIANIQNQVTRKRSVSEPPQEYKILKKKNKIAFFQSKDKIQGSPRKKRRSRKNRKRPIYDNERISRSVQSTPREKRSASPDRVQRRIFQPDRSTSPDRGKLKSKMSDKKISPLSLGEKDVQFPKLQEIDEKIKVRRNKKRSHTVIGGGKNWQYVNKKSEKFPNISRHPSKGKLKKKKSKKTKSGNTGNSFKKKTSKKKKIGIVVFKWIQSGKKVYIVGSMTKWKKKIKLSKSKQKFHYKLISLVCKKYQYRFIVDGEVVVDKKLPTEISGHDGKLCNVISCTNEVPKANFDKGFNLKIKEKVNKNNEKDGFHQKKERLKTLEYPPQLPRVLETVNISNLNNSRDVQINEEKHYMMNRLFFKEEEQFCNISVTYKHRNGFTTNLLFFGPRLMK